MGNITHTQEHRIPQGAPTPNKQQTIFLLVSWRAPNKHLISPRFVEALTWGRGVDPGLSAFIVSIKYFKITKQTDPQHRRLVFTPRPIHLFSEGTLTRGAQPQVRAKVHQVWGLSQPHGGAAQPHSPGIPSLLEWELLADQCPSGCSLSRRVHIPSGLDWLNKIIFLTEYCLLAVLSRSSRSVGPTRSPQSSACLGSA